MYRINALLERVAELDYRLAVVAFVLFVITIIFLPKRYYFAATIALAVAWINLGRFSALGAAAAFAKATFLLPLVLVWLMATLHAGPRRDAPWVSWLYVATSLWAMLCVMQAQDATQVLIYNLCFLGSAIAALQVVRTITTRESLQYVMIAYGIGLLVPFLIVVYAMLDGGPQHYLESHGTRFSPFGSVSNQTIPLLLQLVFVGMYLFHTLDRGMWRLLPVFIAGIAAAMALKTGSRQGFLMLAIFAVPYVLTVVRRPIYLMLFGCIGVGAFAWVFVLGGEESQMQLNRATNFSDKSGRDTIALQYLEVIAENPVTGLMGRTVAFAMASPEVGTHAHNSYLEMLYWGGVLLGVPLLAAALYTLWASAVVVVKRKKIALAPESLVVLASAMLALYLHGVTNNMLYTSVSTWPFFHFLLSGILCALYADLRAAARQPHAAAAVGAPRPAF